MGKWWILSIMTGALWAQDCRPNISVEIKGQDYYALPSWDKVLSFIQPADTMETIAPGMGFILTQPQWEPPAYRGVFYCSWIQADGGTPPYTYASFGLPFGISLDSVTGQITGIPLARGVYQKIVYVATDATGMSISIFRYLRVCGVGENCDGFN